MPVFKREKDIESYVFNNLEEILNIEIIKKKRQCPPCWPYLKDIEGSYCFGFPNHTFSFIGLKRCDILAVDSEHTLHIIEVKYCYSNNGSWGEFAKAITQLLEYYRLAVGSEIFEYNKIKLYIISNRDHVDVHRLIEFYNMPIKVIICGENK